MEKIAFKMKLKPGMSAEYQRRHDAIWPELVTLLRDNGVAGSIFSRTLIARIGKGSDCPAVVGLYA